MTVQPRILLYSADGCPWAHRARIALKAVGANAEIVEINLRDKPVWYQPKVNPASKVPAVWFDAPADADPTNPPAGTFILPESGLIVDLAFNAFPGKVSYGSTLLDAQSALVANQYETTVAPKHGPLSRGTSPNTEEAVAAYLEAVKKWTKQYLTDDFVARKEFGKGDVLIAPFVTRTFNAARIDAGSWPEGTGTKLYEILTTDPELKNFYAYYQKLNAWDAVTSTIDTEKWLASTKANGEKWRAEKAAAASA